MFTCCNKFLSSIIISIAIGLATAYAGTQDDPSFLFPGDKSARMTAGNAMLANNTQSDLPGMAPEPEGTRHDRTKSPVNIIFDTDIGLDCDDAGALAVLHALADMGEAKILAMAYSSASEWGAPCLASLNTYFGHPEIPVGTLKDAGKDYDLYYPSVGAGYNRDIAIRWPAALKNGKEAADVVALYRKVLASQPDNSVVIVTTGNLRNLYKLLQSTADTTCPLSGSELVKQKVKTWVCMGGSYPSGDEYSFCIDGKAASYVVANWPTPAIFSGFEIGIKIHTGQLLFKKEYNSPLCLAYERDAGKGNNASSWALTAVLSAVRGPDTYWSPVTGTCQAESNGHNTWQSAKNGRHAYLEEKMSNAAIARVLDDLMIRAHAGKSGASPSTGPSVKSKAVARSRPSQYFTEQAEPNGQVFREYSWDAAEGLHVLALNEDPFAIPAVIDLENAVRAEVTLEISSEHMGFEGLGIRLNGNQWYSFSYPENSPQNPSPSLWYQHWYPTVPVELQDLKNGAGNIFELKAGHRCFDTTSVINVGIVVHTPWFPIYGVTLRVFYDPKLKPHPTGRILTPDSNSTVGLSVPLTAEAKSENATITQIDFIGRYEDINYEGDNIYNQWHGHPFHGRITHHLGTRTQPNDTVVWNTSWVPDQAEPMAIAARITDSNGIIYLTEPVKNIKLDRPGLSVELCKPFDVPRSFTAAQYGAWVVPGVRTEKFIIHGDLTRVIDARYATPSWGDLKASPGYTINGVVLEDKPVGADWRYNLSTPEIRPLTVLKSGENTFSTIPSQGRLADVYVPGAQILVRYHK